MQEDGDDNSPQQSTTNIGPVCYKSRTNIKPTKSLGRVQNQRFRIYDTKNESSSAFRDEYIYSSTSKVEPPFCSRPREGNEEKCELISKRTLVKEGKVFSSPEFVVRDCWKATSGEIPVKLIELFKDSNAEEEDTDMPVKRRKLSLEEDNEKLSYTKEFHMLTEVQKAKILTAVEDAIKKLANSDFNDYLQGAQGRRPENQSFVSDGTNVEKYFCKKFLLPWVIMKVIEMVLCHITQLTFLSNDSYFQRKNEFLPVVVTYYLTLFIIVISLILHISCYSYVGVLNPCYFMGVISSSILTLTTALGIFILLCSMEYYRSFREIMVLVFVGAILCTLIAELCICYIEVKNFWNKMGHTDHYYIP